MWPGASDPDHSQKSACSSSAELSNTRGAGGDAIHDHAEPEHFDRQVFRCTKNTAAAVLERPSAKRRRSGEGLETVQPGNAAAASSPSAAAHEAAARSPSGLASSAVEAVTITDDAREPDGANVGSDVGQQAGGAARLEVAGVAAATYVKGSKPRGLPEKLGDRPLRLMLVGHNPSDHAWCALPRGQSAARCSMACRRLVGQALCWA